MRKLLLLLAAVAPLSLFAQHTIVHCGKLIDVNKSQVLSGYSIIIDGNKITDVQAGYVKAAAGDKVIDLKNRTVMPGLIDCHVHLEDETSPNQYLQKYTFNPADYAFQSVGDSAKKPGYYPDLVTLKALAIGPKIQSTFANAYKAGVKIAFGTDAGVYMHGKNWMEFVYMNEAGMPVLEAIRCATVAAADLLGMSAQVGSIEKGKLADIVAVEGDPVKDVQVMGKMKFVMKDGVVYKQE